MSTASDGLQYYELIVVVLTGRHGFGSGFAAVQVVIRLLDVLRGLVLNFGYTVAVSCVR